ncbi:MAG: hypothetical protein ACOYOS_00060 [Syntrophales bacterium]
MARSFAKIKIDAPYNDMAEYKRLWGKEYAKDPKRVMLVNSPEYKAYMKQYSHEYRRREGYKGKKNQQTRGARAILRLEIQSHYSSGALTCARCGFGDVRALDLDHIENNGGDHRKAIGRRGATYDIYAELKRHGFPEGYQILCRNCNWIKEMEKRSQRQCDASTPATREEANG